MFRRELTALALAVSLVSISSRAHAQVALTVSGGASIPMGDYSDYAKTGYLVSAGLMVPVGAKGVAVGAHGIFGMNTHSDYDGDKTKLLGVLAAVRYRFGDATKPGVFVIGNAGMLRHQYSSDQFPNEEGSSSGVAFGGGAGFDIPRGSMSFYALARYLTASIDDETTAFVPVQVGVSIPLGKKK